VVIEMHHRVHHLRKSGWGSANPEHRKSLTLRVLCLTRAWRHRALLASIRSL
jgi:hypothetical protein